ncbi:MAG: CHAD domain-containing protein [Planctomycetaceae bacterium]
MSGTRQRRNWVVLEAESTPVGRVAARTIRARLEAVWTELRAAVRGPVDAESVHRLRVATRRTLAAFEAFADLLPGKRTAWFSRRLRELRRVAGDARDLDVLTGRLAARPPTDAGLKSKAAAARGRLVAMLARQRDVSREPIRDLHDRLAAAGWEERVEEFLARIPSGSRQPSFAAYARECFAPLVDRFFAKADRRLRDDDDVHRLRIAGKKLRYALEIFAPVVPQRARARCQDALERLQHVLGEFTDHASAADRFQRLARDGRTGLDQEAIDDLRRVEAAAAAEARKAFVRWWDRERRRDLRRTIERSIGRRSA